MDAFAHFGVRDAEDGGVHDGRVGDEDVFGFLGVDVHAAGDDGVGFAVGEVEVAVGVQVADVAERGPAIWRVRAGGGGGVVVVFEGGAAGEEDVAGFAGGERGAGFRVQNFDLADRRAADAAAVGEPVSGIDNGDAIAFGAGVVFQQDFAPPGDHRLLHVRRAGGGGVDGAFERGDVGGGAPFGWEFQQADEHGGDALGMGHAMLTDELEEGFGVEFFHDDGGGADGAGEHGEAQGGGVVERGGGEVDGVLVHAAHLAAEDFEEGADGGDGQAAQGLFDALGAAGGAGGIEHVGAGGLVRDGGGGVGGERG